MNIAIIVLLLGCTGAEPPPSDRDHYMASVELASSDPGAAAASCAQIEEAALAGECQSFAAVALAKAGGEALPVCEAVRDPVWRQSCRFEVVDALALTGDEAIAACQDAGQWKERCLSHAIQRELSRVAPRYGLGQELELTAWIEERVVAYGLQSTRPDYAGEQVARVIARRRSRTGPAPTFTRAECGTASDSVCQEAYRVIVRERDQGRRISQGVCATTVDSASVTAAGLPGWEEDVADVVRAAWVQICREARGPGGR